MPILNHQFIPAAPKLFLEANPDLLELSCTQIQAQMHSSKLVSHDPHYTQFKSTEFERQKHFEKKKISMPVSMRGRINKVNPRELNPYFKENGTGYPEDSDRLKSDIDKLPPPRVVGDGGASWRLKALKRAEEQAARDGRRLEEACSLLLLSASKVAPSRSHLHAIRNRKRGLTSHQPSDGQNESDSGKSSARDHLKDISSRNPEMREPKVRDSLSWGKQKGQNVSSRDAGFISVAVSSLNKFSDDGSFASEFLRQQRENTKGDSIETKVKSELVVSTSEKHIEDCASAKDAMSANQLAAKAFQLQIKGKHEEAQKLLNFGELDRGRMKVSKIRDKAGWVLSCDFWPMSGGHSNIRVGSWVDKQGWSDLHTMLKSFLTKSAARHERLGGWLKIKNLPLDYLSRTTFEVISYHFGGLKNIATDTVNPTNRREARIKVKQNLCGFVHSTVEITNSKRGNIFLNFGDFKISNPPVLLKHALSKLQTRIPTGNISSSPPFLKIICISWRCAAPKPRLLIVSTGSTCHSAVSIKKQVNVVIGDRLPLSVSSKESMGLMCPSDHKADAEIEVVDLNILFEVDCASLGHAPGPPL
ncbi:CWF19-like protein 2-like protein [Cucumis melo var. makuwa]|uniref:CWF19-like protein 2-like protein n=1 Tax=Cucumis melo var. makuwa TaxID=1194695 RepID=A0A5D3CRV4_CUCMM|nr:CWF19-like protein 2-like protein [Cucumis melo var. makuwa]